MAENESLTPEKQLLRLIENPKQASVRVENAKREGKKWFSFPALKGRFDFWKNSSAKQRFSLGKFTKSSYGVEQINFILKVLFVVVVIYTAYSIWEMARGIKKASHLILAPDKASAETVAPTFSLQNISYYMEKIKGRNVFSPAQLVKKAGEEKTAVVTPNAEENPIKDLTLVGIAWSDDPEAMIEDKKSGRTFFVKRGQTLANSFRIVAIFKDKAILNYEDKEYELR